MNKFEIAEMLSGDRTEGFIRKVGECLFEIVDFYYYMPEYSHILVNTIDTSKFTNTEKLDAVSSFDLDSLEEVALEYGDENYESIVAQCLFMTQEQFDKSERIDMPTEELVKYIKEKYDITLDRTKFIDI